MSAFDTLNPNSTLNLIKNTITCGRVGTAMPAWGVEHGGPLSDEQIRQLTLLIMQGRWDLVAERDRRGRRHCLPSSSSRLQQMRLRCLSAT